MLTSPCLDQSENSGMNTIPVLRVEGRSVLQPVVLTVVRSAQTIHSGVVKPDSMTGFVIRVQTSDRS